MSKQDRQGVRTPADLERKYGLGSLGRQYAEVLGVATDTRESVDRVESELRSELSEQITSLVRDTESIIMSALESYVEESEYEELKQTVQSELAILAEKVTINFTSTTEQLAGMNSDLLNVIETLQKNFEFNLDGLTIKAGENAMSLVLDNDLIKFVKDGKEFGWWDGVDFHTGNIVIGLTERAQMGNYAFVPRSDGSLDFLKVGG
jgi:gas vesicle protein